MENLRELITEEAMKYANSMVEDPDNHEDAVTCIATDFIEGALFAVKHIQKLIDLENIIAD